MQTNSDNVAQVSDIRLKDYDNIVDLEYHF